MCAFVRQWGCVFHSHLLSVSDDSPGIDKLYIVNRQVMTCSVVPYRIVRLDVKLKRPSEVDLDLFTRTVHADSGVQDAKCAAETHTWTHAHK